MRPRAWPLARPLFARAGSSRVRILACPVYSNVFITILIKFSNYALFAPFTENVCTGSNASDDVHQDHATIHRLVNYGRLLVVAMVKMSEHWARSVGGKKKEYGPRAIRLPFFLFSFQERTGRARVAVLRLGARCIVCE